MEVGGVGENSILAELHNKLSTLKYDDDEIALDNFPSLKITASDFDLHQFGDLSFELDNGSSITTSNPTSPISLYF